MAIRWAVASGNWSSTATWNSGASLGVPTASDDVYANNQTVTVDTNISVLSLRNSATSSAVARGSYVINNGVTVTAPTIISSTGSMMLISQSNSATIIGNISCATTASAICLTMSDTSSLTITGSVSTAGNVANIRGIVNTSIGTLIITGSVNGGGSSTSYGIYKSSGTGTVIITGSINAGTVAGGSTIRSDGNSTNYYILGNIVGGISNCFLDNVASSNANLYITGSITGTLSNTTQATIYKTLSGTVSVLGNVTGFDNAGIVNAGGTTIVNGTVTAGPQAPGVSSTTGTVIVSGPFVDVNGYPAIYSPNIQIISGSSTTWTFSTETTAVTKTLYTDRDPQTYPSASDVRNGVVYGATNQLIGTAIIPSSSAVIKGVLVDNTTGSATFTTQNAWASPTSSLSSSLSIGNRLSNTATVAQVAAAIASKGTI